MVGRTNSQIDQLHAKFTQRQTSSSILQQRTQNKLQNIKWNMTLNFIHLIIQIFLRVA